MRPSIINNIIFPTLTRHDGMRAGGAVGKTNCQSAIQYMYLEVCVSLLRFVTNKIRS